MSKFDLIAKKLTDIRKIWVISYAFNEISPNIPLPFVCVLGKLEKMIKNFIIKRLMFYTNKAPTLILVAFMSAPLHYFEHITKIAN